MKLITRKVRRRRRIRRRRRVRKRRLKLRPILRKWKRQRNFLKVAKLQHAND